MSLSLPHSFTLQWRHNGHDGLTIVYPSIYSGADLRKNLSFASLASVRGIHRWPVKIFPLDYVIMTRISHRPRGSSYYGQSFPFYKVRQRIQITNTQTHRSLCLMYTLDKYIAHYRHLPGLHYICPGLISVIISNMPQHTIDPKVCTCLVLATMSNTPRHTMGRNCHRND